MTEGRLSKQILLFSIPLILSNLLQVLFNMADIAVVGQFSGAEALGAVGSTVILVGVFTGFLIGVGSGVNALCARLIGAEDDAALKKNVHSSLIICVIVGAILAVTGVAATNFMLRLLGTKDELFDGAALYLHIYFLGMPALAVYNYGNGVMSAAGNTKTPLFYLAAAGIMNVVLNVVFVVGLGMSVDGVAIASIISQYFSAFMIVRYLLKSQSAYALRMSDMRLYKGYAEKVLALGVPSGVQNAIFQIANLFIQRALNSFPAVVVEGNSAAANADALVYDVMAAFYMACASFMSQNIGALKRKRVTQSYFICLAYSFFSAAVMGCALVLFGKEFLAIFTRDAAVADAGMYRLKIMGLSYAVSAFMDCTIAASRGIGKTVVPTAIVILGSCVFRVVWVYTVFAHFRTITSLYLLYVFSWSITAAAEIVYFAVCYRRMRLDGEVCDGSQRRVLLTVCNRE